MTPVLVHGFPETAQIWDPLRADLGTDAVAVALPGFGTGRPDGFAGTKDDYAEWLGETLRRIDGPIDLVGHDVGALLAMRVASAFDVPLRSWAVDVADIFHPDFTERLGAETARLDGLNHCWMAEAPAVVAAVLKRFWSSLE